MAGTPSPGLRLEYKANTQQLFAQLKEGLTDGILDFGGLIEERARHNVSPGVGPGPHPHRADHGWEWQDTGTLRDDIEAEPYQAQNRVGVLVGAWSVGYGRYLELGFHGPSGTFYRYPWLQPALDWARPQLEPLVRRGVTEKVRVYR